MSFLFVSLCLSAVDHYTLGKEVLELSRFQHSTGGFMDEKSQSPNIKDTFRSLYILSTFGGLQQVIRPEQCVHFLQTLRNRDGGAAPSPGQISTIEATYYYARCIHALTGEKLDPITTTEFLNRHYDQEGLFKDSLNSKPSLRATLFAFLLIQTMDVQTSADLGWLDQNKILSHIRKDQGSVYKFNGIEELDAQIYGCGLSKLLKSGESPIKLSAYVQKFIDDAMKDGSVSVEQVGKLAEAFYLIELEEPFAQSAAQFAALGGSLADLYHSVQVLSFTSGLDQYFDVQILAESPSGVIDLSKDGVAIRTMIKPLAYISAFGRLVNNFIAGNVTLFSQGVPYYTSGCRFDRRSFVFPCDKPSTATKLGLVNVEATFFVASPLAAPVTLHKSIVTHVTLPVDVVVEAKSHNDEIIEVGGEVTQGTQFSVTVNGLFADDFKIEEGTRIAFSVTDVAGTVLHFEGLDFAKEHTFAYTLDYSHPLTDGVIVSVQVGDDLSGVHTKHEFRYTYASHMVAVSHSFEQKPKLGDMFKVSMIPGAEYEGSVTKFSNAKVYEGELIDAAKASFYPMTPVDSHKYNMVLKTGKTVVKTIDGEVSEKDGHLSVDFETTIDNCLDFVSGFQIEFQFVNADHVATKLQHEEINVNVVSDVVVDSFDGNVTKGGAVKYHDKLSCSLTLKDQVSKQTLSKGRSSVFLVVKKDSKIVNTIRGEMDASGKIKISLPIDASFSQGKYTVSVALAKGQNEFEVLSHNGKKLSVDFSIDAKLEFKSSVQHHNGFITVDYTAVSGKQELTGGAFQAKILTRDGQVVRVLPVATLKKGARLTIPTKKLSGEYNVELLREGDGSSLLVTKVATKSFVTTWLQGLPYESIAILASLVVFSYAIYLRRGLKRQFQSKK